MAEQRRGRLLIWILLTAIVAVGAWLRSLGLQGSLWLDELHTAWIVSGDFTDVAPRAMIGNQPPLPYWLLWPYVQIFGVNECSLRLPSFFASVISIVLVCVLVERWTKNAAAALVAAMALAIQSDSFAFYASEARVYALGQCLALVHLLVFDHVLRGGRWRWRVGWVVLGWLLFYVHYTLAMLVVAELVAWLACYLWRRDMVHRLRYIAVDVLVFALGCLPAVPHLMQIAARRKNWEFFIERPQWQELFDHVPHENALWWLMAGWLGIITVLWWNSGTPEETDGRLVSPVDRYAIALVIAWLCVPLMVTWLVARLDVARLFYPRYLVYTLPSGGALIALLATMIPVRALRGAYMVAAVVVLATWNVWLCYVVFGGLVVERNEDWRGAIAALNARQWHENEPLFIAAGLIEAEELRTRNDPALREFCAYPLHGAYPLTAPCVREMPLPFRSPGKLSVADAVVLRDWLQTQPSALFVVRGNEETARAVAADVSESLDERVAPKHFQGFGSVWVFEVRAAE